MPMRFSLRLVVAVLLAIGLSGAADAQWPLNARNVPKAKEPGLSATAAGRFQVFVSPRIKSATFMIDTDTGKIWIFKKDHSTGDFSLKRVPVENVDKDGKSGTKTDKTGDHGKTSPSAG
jgi:hypothetical protein